MVVPGYGHNIHDTVIFQVRHRRTHYYLFCYVHRKPGYITAIMMNGKYFSVTATLGGKHYFQVIVPIQVRKGRSTNDISRLVVGKFLAACTADNV